MEARTVPKASTHRRAVPTRQDASKQLERILASNDFDASPRSRAFVRFIVDEALEGRAEALSQAAIATSVFGRREDFDPTVDPIVRIQAGRLRRSLERYYLLAGAQDPVRIELPRGTYVPAVRWADHPEGHEREERPSPGTPGDGWPVVVVRSFEVDGRDAALLSTAASFNEQVCVEMGRYGDVRVARAAHLERLGASAGTSGDFELAGRIESDGSGTRITAHLLDRRSASQAWAEEYRGQPQAPASFYEETAHVIAARVASEQGMVARQIWAAQRHLAYADVSPYGAVLRSYHFFFDRDPADFPPALEALQRAVGEWPDCGLAWVQLARLHLANFGHEIARPASSIDEAVSCAQKGVGLDPGSPRARSALAGAFLLKGELAAGRAEAEKAYELNGDSLVYLEWIGWLLAMAGDWERGTALVRRAMARNPSHNSVAAVHALWADHLRRAEFEQAYQVALQLREPLFFWRPLMRAACLGHLGRLEEAKREAAELLRFKPNFRERGRILIGRQLHSAELLERVVEGLRRAGVVLDKESFAKGRRRDQLTAEGGAT